MSKAYEGHTTFAELKPKWAVDISRQGLDAKIKRGQFPAPVHPRGNRLVAWRDCDIAAWIEARNAEGNAK